MSRLPFNPDKMEAARLAAARDKAQAQSALPSLTVSQLADLIDSTLRDRFAAPIRVVGEISGFKEQTHWYFQLKDDAAVVSCVMWASAARHSPFRPDSGQQVLATGRIEFYAKAGRTTFHIDKLEPIGAGALDLEFKRLCDELRTLGWFAPERKRPIPRFPRRIAVITSRTGAALQDVLDTAKKRCPAVDIAIIDVRVQGDAAARDIAATLRALARIHDRERLDAILLTRGGGSKEDLWAFNDRDLARAILDSPIPIVAAIGHETDTTIAELVADLRCATPTQAAMRLTPDSAACLEQLDTLADRLAAMMVRLCRHERERLRSAARHPFFTDPASLTSTPSDRADQLSRRLRTALLHASASAAARTERAAARLERHRPAAVYARRQADLSRLEGLLHSALTIKLRCADPESLATRLSAAWRTSLDRSSLELDAAERALELVGPASVLRRGFSCTLRDDGSAVRSTADVRPGDRIRTLVRDGAFTSTVQPASASASAPLPPAAPALPAPSATPSAWTTRRQRRTRARATDATRHQLDLFTPPPPPQPRP